MEREETVFSGTEIGLEMEPEDFYGAQDDEFRVLNAVSEVHPSTRSYGDICSALTRQKGIWYTSSI